MGEGTAHWSPLDTAPRCGHSGALAPNKIRLRLQAPPRRVNAQPLNILRVLQFCRCGQQRGGRLQVRPLQLHELEQRLCARGSHALPPVRAITPHCAHPSAQAVCKGQLRGKRPRAAAEAASAAGCQRGWRHPLPVRSRMSAPDVPNPLAFLRFPPPFMPEPEAVREDKAGGMPVHE